jgi:primosomal protein N' (replication factor Y)
MVESPGPWVQVAFPLPLDNEFTYRLPEDFQARGPLEGRRVRAPFRNGEKDGVIVGFPGTEPASPEKIKTLSRVLDDQGLFGPFTLMTARWMARQYFCSLGEALAAMVPVARKERNLPAWTAEESAADHDLVLSEEQAEAVRSLIHDPEKLYYLKGMTGSGKTEVFLQTAHWVLDQGRQVVYLVPEIALTWQLRETLIRRFGTTIAVLHSRLTPAQKLKEWRRIQAGEASFVVGARSAVFAPVAKPGLFILDEEHEGGYKSSNTPRYHARQVALWLAAKAGAKVVLGSATPSLEAVHLMRENRLKTLTLSRRLAGGAPPAVRLVNLRGNSSSLTPELIEAIHATLARKRQVVLFLNRRGFSQSFRCQTCGHEAQCKNCSVGMTWHKGRDILLCHYCGYQARPTKVCPVCGSLDIGWAVVGTEHIEEEIHSLFPSARIARLDSDTAEVKGQAEQIVEAFRRGELDLLVGTQMVAKGLNFPGLQLVGLLHADLGLALPDFRAAERVFGLIRQVSGRAGRFLPDGQVIVQTYRPDSPAVLLAAQGRDEDFWTQELATRRALDFPPFTRLIRIVVRGRDEAKVRSEASMLAEALRQAFPGPAYGPEVLGPVECPLATVAGNRRWQVLLRSTDFPLMHHGLISVIRTRTAGSGTYREIDVDPLSML